MVRPDPSRDLYHDLEISPQCSQDDIKKQFHKLALKYHPDRNPGHEAEFATRFQIIQAANEILSNPEQRRKYDLSRPLGSGTTTAGGGSAAPSFQRPASSGVRGHPYKAESAFPPPPRRTAAGNAPPPPRTAPAAAAASSQDGPPQPPLPGRGADRYTFAKPPQPPPKPTTAAQAARNRMDNARAWESIRPEQARPSAPQSSMRPVPPAWTGHRYTEDEIPRPSSERMAPRSAFEAVHGSPRPKTSRTTSRRAPHAFDPGSPLGDEGPAAASAYTSVPFDRSQEPAPPRPPSSRKSTNEEDDPAYNLNPRPHRPYGTVRRETTYTDAPGSEGLRRAMSVKDATKLHHPVERDDASETSERRHRSLSPTRRRSPPRADAEEAYRASKPKQRRSFRPGEWSSDDSDTSTVHKPSPAYNLRKENLTASSSDPNMRRRSSHSSHLSPTGDERHPHFSESYEEIPRRASHSSAVPPSAPNDAFKPDPRSPTSPRKTTFSSEKWQRELREDEWAQNMSDMEAGSNTSPTKGPAGNSRRPRTAPTRPSIKQPSSSNHSHASGGLNSGFADLGVNDTSPADPMDVDDPPSPNARAPGPRNVYVEPSRPEWRDGHSNERHNSSARQQGLPSMDSFRHVSPFDMKTSGGVDNLSDLKSNLPFQSQPSSLHPSRTASYQDGDEQIDSNRLYNIPTAPTPPTFPTTPSKWVAYLRDMGAYFKQWTRKYSEYVSHFQEHATQISDIANGPADGWLGASGENGSVGVFGTYTNMLEDDARWRKAWDIFCERHFEAMRVHGEIRRGVKEGRLKTNA